MGKRASEKAALRVAMLSPRCRADGVTLGLLLTLMFWGGILLRCGDVEKNPGPQPDNQPILKQTRLTRGSVRSASVDPASGRTASGDAASADPASGRTASTDPASRRTASTDPVSGRTASTDPASRPDGGLDSGQSLPQQTTMDDVMKMLHSMNCKFDSMNSKVDTMSSKIEEVEKGVKELSQQYASMQNEVKDLREEVGKLSTQNEDLVTKNSQIMEKIYELEKKNDDLEGRSKRNNLIFYGIPREQNESNEQCEGKVRDLLTDKLNFTREIEFDRVHRLSMKPDSPVIARCCFFKDKVRILKVKKNLKGSDVFIGEDFSARVRETRRKLSPHLKEARNKGQRVAMVFDHLLIDGRKFCLDNENNLKESR